VYFAPQSGNEQANYNAASVVLNNPPISLIFWGSAWNTNAANRALIAPVVADTQKVLTNGYLNGLTQYAPFLSAATFGRSVQTNLDPPQNFTSADIEAIVTRAIDEGAVPRTTGLPLVVTPPGIRSAVQNAGGYHAAYQYNATTKVAYGWIGSNLPGGVDGIMKVVTHELVEGMTDPYPSTGITVTPGASFRNGTDNGMELADYEAVRYSARITGVSEQSYWSQADKEFTVPDAFTQHIEVTVLFAGGGAFLYLNGDQNANLNDTIVIGQTPGGEVQVTMNGEVVSFPASLITDIRINPGAGNNNVAVVAAPGVQTLKVKSSGNDIITLGDPVRGMQPLGSLKVTIENVGGAAGAGDIINLNDAPDPTARTVTLAPLDPATDLSLVQAPHGQITGLAAVQVVYLYDNTRNLNVHTGTGANQVNVQATGTTTGIYTNGATSVQVGASGSVQSILGQLEIESQIGARSNTVTVDDSADPTGRNATVETAIPPSPPYPDADRFGVIQGLAPGEIRYEYNDTIQVSINLGTGDDTMHVDDPSPIPVTLDGGSGANTLSGPAASSTFDITGANAVTLGVISATGFGSLRGGAGDDRFVFEAGAALAGSIDGGGGTNTLDYTNYGGPFQVDLRRGTATGVARGIKNIQRVVP
jgi:hypothetical protein